MYLITSAGRAAWESQDAAIPEDYRRILWLIDIQGATKAVEGLREEYPAKLVQDWLQELEELRLLEARTPSHKDKTSSVVIDGKALKAGAEAASELSRVGAYLFHASAGTAKPASETTILIVEDDADQLALADLRVTSANYRVRTATSVTALVRTLTKDGPPDLILLDVLLPDGNGLDVLAKLRRHPDFGRLPVVLLTVLNEPTEVAKGFVLGASGYVTKPYSKNVLIGVIKGALA